MSTALDEDLTVLENLDFEPECGAPWCSSTATWSAVLKCCGFELLMCDPCRVNEMRLIKYGLARTCISCGGPASEENVEWTPL